VSKRIVVVGGLAAGPSAASKAARTNGSASVVLLEKSPHTSYGICEIPYFISGEVDGSRLVSYTPDALKERKQVDARAHHLVEEISPGKRFVSVRNLKTGKTNQEYYDRLILATGARSKRLNVEGEDARNLFFVRWLDDAYQLKTYLQEEKPKTAVVIGAGYVGLEMTEALTRCGLQVTVLHKSSLPLSYMEHEVRERIRSIIDGQGVQFHGMVRTEGFVLGRDRKVTHVVTSEGTFDCDLVIECVGVEPQTELATAVGIRTGSFGGILADQRQETNIDNILAAGDCCEVRNIINKKMMYLPLATISSKTGWVAGENAAGGNAVFRGAIRAIAIRVFGLEVIQVGISSEEARDSGFDVVVDSITAWSKVGIMPGATKLTVVTIADRKSKRLLGANIYGSEGAVLRGNTLAVAIQQGISVDDIQQWDLAYSPPFTPLWDPILVAANSLRKKL